MNISVYPREALLIGPDGRTRYHRTKVLVEFSPSDGYDCEKLAKLEKDLAGFIDERLDDALKKEEP